ncbi:hypothetical protein [Virgibacillus ainsalahensis]
MEFHSEFIMNAASGLIKSSSQSISERIRVSKTTKQKDNTIEELQEIITELIDERNDLLTLAQAYEEKLISQRISESDIDYITNELLPLLQELILKSSQEDKEKLQSQVDIVKTLLSKETFNIMQLLGFNFKQAIGEPLTQLLKNLITAQIPEKGTELRSLIEQREIHYLKLVQDEKAYERYKELLGR